MQEKRIKKSKFKHQKRRNTYFLYEALLREMTKTVVESNSDKKKEIVSIFKEFFGSNSILKQELNLYKVVNETTGLSREISTKILEQAKLAYAGLNKKSLFDAQTKLINRINSKVGSQTFSTFVPNYKNIATLSQIFNGSLPIKERVILEHNVVEKMTLTEQKVEEEKLQPLDSLTYRTFVKKFNQEYGTNLLQEQKELLSNYIMSFADNGLEFKVYLNEELGKIKEHLNNCLSVKEISEDKDMLEKTKKIISLVESYNQRQIDEKMIKEILKIQSLIKEVNSEDSRSNVN